MKTRNLKTQTLSILLTIVMLLGMLPMSAFAIDDGSEIYLPEIIQVDENGQIIPTEDGKTLPGDIELYVTSSGDDYFVGSYITTGRFELKFIGYPLRRAFTNGSCRIVDGTFSSSVENNNLILGGTYNHVVTNQLLATIKNGTFNGTVTNYGAIEDGTFHAPVINYGTIKGGTFNELVTNYGTIEGGTFNGKILNIGGTVASGVKGTVVEGGNLTLNKNIYGTGEIAVKQSGVDIPSGKAGERYNIAGFDPNRLVGLYMLREGETIPSEKFSIDESVFTPVGFLGFVGQYDFTMPNEAVTIAAVFSDYEFAPVSVSAASSDSYRGSVSGGGNFIKGDKVTLTATPAQENVQFAYWLDNSVELPEKPTEAELKEAIVSYDSTYTFTAEKDISLTAVFGYKTYVYLTRIAYENENDYMAEETGIGIRLDEEDIHIEIGNAPVTIEKNAFADTETVDGVIYNIGFLVLGIYNETDEAMDYQLLERFDVPAAPVYNSIEYWQWLEQYEQRLTVTYLRHTHTYIAKYDENGHWTECTCEDKTAVQPHSFTSEADTTCDCGYERHVHTYETKYDVNGHWTECTCKDKTAVQPHSFTNETDTTCDCGYTRTVEHIHDWDNWVSNGNDTHTRVCKTDSSHIETESCSGGIAYCIMKAKCSLCKAVYGEYNESNHFSEWDYIWSRDEEYHQLTRKCKSCSTNETIDNIPVNHQYSSDSDLTCDACGYVRTVEGELTITGSMPDATVGEAYSVSFSYTGTVSGIVFWNATGLPDGLTVNYGTGTISGTPTTAGTYNVTVSMGAAGGGSASKTFTLTVKESAHQHSYSTQYNDTYHWEECGCGEKGDEIAHSYSDDADTTCDCGYERHVHTYETKYDEINHWTECACGDKTDVQRHKFNSGREERCACGYYIHVVLKVIAGGYDEHNPEYEWHPAFWISRDEMAAKIAVLRGQQTVDATVKVKFYNENEVPSDDAEKIRDYANSKFSDKTYAFEWMDISLIGEDGNPIRELDSPLAFGFDTAGRNVLGVASVHNGTLVHFDQLNDWSTPNSPIWAYSHEFIGETDLEETAERLVAMGLPPETAVLIADRFSTYAIIYEVEQTPDTPSTPQTGDNSHILTWLTLLFISGGAVITLTVIDRKRRINCKR